MTLTEKHIECAHLCARLEIAGQNTKKMAQKWGVTRATIFGSLSCTSIRRLAEKACALAEFRVDLSDIPLTHRRDRIEVLAGIAGILERILHCPVDLPTPASSGHDAR